MHSLISTLWASLIHLLAIVANKWLVGGRYFSNMGLAASKNVGNVIIIFWHIVVIVIIISGISWLLFLGMSSLLLFYGQ